MSLTRNSTPTVWLRCDGIPGDPTSRGCGFKFDVLTPREWGYMAFVAECPKCGQMCNRRGTNGMWPRTKAAQAKLRELIQRNGGTFLPLYRVVKGQDVVRPPFKLKEVKR